MKVQRWTERRIIGVPLGQVLNLCPSAPDRIWLGVSVPAGGSALGISTLADVTNNNAWIVGITNSTTPPFRLTAANDGVLVRQQWYGSSSTIAPNVAAVVVEVFEEETGYVRSQPAYSESPGGILLGMNGGSGGNQRAEMLRRAIVQAMR